MYSEYLLVGRFPQKRVIDRAIEAYTYSAWSRHSTYSLILTSGWWRLSPERRMSCETRDHHFLSCGL